MTEGLKTTLQLTLRSAATVGRGDGVAGLVDREVEHDQYGFPFLRGRTLKGLLREAAEEVVFALEPEYELNPAQRNSRDWPWHEAQNKLFGVGSSNLAGQGKLSVGDARLPASLRALLMAELEAEKLEANDVLEALTGIRRQTAMNPYGAPDDETLRAMRVVLRSVSFEAELSFAKDLSAAEWTLLAAATLGLRAAGTGRNRGRGWVQATWSDEAKLQSYFARLQPVQPATQGE